MANVMRQCEFDANPSICSVIAEYTYAWANYQSTQKYAHEKAESYAKKNVPTLNEKEKKKLHRQNKTEE